MRVIVILDYSVVIPAYNEESYLPLTIDRLKKAMAAISEKSGELIVVDKPIHGFHFRVSQKT